MLVPYLVFMLLRGFVAILLPRLFVLPLLWERDPPSPRRGLLITLRVFGLRFSYGSLRDLGLSIPGLSSQLSYVRSISPSWSIFTINGDPSSF